MLDTSKRKTSLGLFRALVALALLFSASAVAGETAAERVDRFELFADCRPMRLVVEHLHSDASKIGLTEESLQAAAESRLRSARLYNSEALPYLYINVNVVGHAFSINLSFKKMVHDRLSDITNLAATWDTNFTGTHGGDSGYILSLVSRGMDRFILQFLRLNEVACEKRFALPNSRNTE